MKNLFFIECILTKKCNQDCYYCNVFTATKYQVEEPVVIDLDFLKYSLDCHPTSLMVELCGGEPGLVENIDEVFKILYNHPNVKKIQVMSNGLIRKRNFDWLDRVNYFEHLVFDIEERNVIKFYEELDFNYKYNYVIVSTEKTVKSLSENFDYFKNEGFFRSNFWHKLMNPKTHSIENFASDALELFKKLGDKYSVNMIKAVIKNKKMENERQRCAINPPQPIIDFETKEYGHCGVCLIPSARFELSKQNALKNMNCDLFPYADYCKTCYVFDSGDKKKCIRESLNGRYINRSILLTK